MDRRKSVVTILAGVMAAIMLLSLLLGLFAGAASAATSSEIQAQIEDLKQQQAQVNDRLGDLENSLAQNNGQLQSLVDRKNGIDGQITLLHRQIALVSQQLSACNLLIADKQVELDQAEERLNTLTQAYKDRIRAMEEQGDLNYWSVIFKASSFSDLLDRLNMVAEIANSDRRRMENLKVAAAEVAEARESLLADKQALEDTKRTLLVSEETLQDKRAESDALLTEMVAKGEEYKKLLEELELEQNTLMQEIANANQAYEAEKLKEWLATSVPPTTQPAPTVQPTSPNQSNPPVSAVWYHPLGNAWYVVTDRFGMRLHPTLGIYAPHDGIDLAARSMTPIYASRAGAVVITGIEDKSAGNYVSINHGDGYSTIYMHMEYFVVEVGQFVSAGQLIGFVGTSGASTGYHLHFGIAYDGTWIDPETIMRF